MLHLFWLVQFWGQEKGHRNSKVRLKKNVENKKFCKFWTNTDIPGSKGTLIFTLQSIFAPSQKQAKIEHIGKKRQAFEGDLLDKENSNDIIHMAKKKKGNKKTSNPQQGLQKTADQHNAHCKFLSQSEHYQKWEGWLQGGLT